MTFVPRTTFAYASHASSWFAGHMSRSLTRLPEVLKDIDLVIEARDARLPLTSINPAFDEVLEQAWGNFNGDRKGKGKEKLVVYMKRDLAETRFEEPLRNAFRKHANQAVLFADTRVDRDVRKILRHVVDYSRARYEDAHDMNILVVGMPNVGKSSFLNALRRVGVKRGKAFRVSALPGLTRKLTGTVKVHETPPIYVFDTPGIMVPYLGKGQEGLEKGMKLALTNGIKQSLFEPEILADYLLYRLNLRRTLPSNDPNPYPGLPLPIDFTERTNHLEELLSAMARRLGTLKPGGSPDTLAAQRYMLKSFQEGKLGKWTLDELLKAPVNENQTDGDVKKEVNAAVEDSVAAYLAEQERAKARRAEGIAESRTQEKKQAKKEAVEERARRNAAKFAAKSGG